MTTFGSCCSGIESASVAWEPLGWQAAWLAEIEPFPCSVLAHHYPSVANLGDMTKIAALVRAGKVSAPDVLVGGTPCQSFSIAGMRAGLADPRGQLTYSYVELANAIDSARSVLGQSPCITVWENVPGVLSSKDNAFGCFLGALAGESCELQPAGGRWTDAGCVFGSQRAIAWRVLDAQYFGLAQRRRRVFVVASARAGFDPSQVLFEFGSVRRDSPPSREQGEKTSSNAGAGSDVSTVTFDRQSSGEYSDNPIASTISARDYKSASDLVISVHGTQDPDINNNMAHALGRNNGQENAVFCDGSLFSYGIPGNWIGRAPENGGNATEPHVDRSPCLTAADRHGVAYGVGISGGELGFALRSNPSASGDKGDGGMNCSVAIHNMQVRRLLPIECERLQGFPDNWTLVPHRGKPAADGSRYKALGNSMAVNVMAWIGGRIAAYLGRDHKV
ncbi:DNA cytosine methyltransferase [Polynucleobacter sp.]|uniref:DNA cytosine methyltransferase n=1 Tax=Polynucleobacter sp. TaxID=2029855 RepID=UPI003F698F57